MITTCALLHWPSRNERLSPLNKCMQRRHMLQNQRTHTNGLDQPIQIHQMQIGTFSCQCFQLPIYAKQNSKYSTIYPTSSFCLHISTMDALKYWPFAWEFSIWNARVTAPQFWTAALKPHILSNAIAQVYADFFYSDHTQQIQNLPEEILFGCFMTTLNDVLETELTQEDEGYESGSENFNILFPLSRALRIYHISMVEDLSFNLANFGQSPTTQEQHEWSSPCRHIYLSLTCCYLVFTSSDDESPMRASEWCSPCSSTKAKSWPHRRGDLSPSVHHNLCHHITPTTDWFLTTTWVDDTSCVEHFPRALLDDGVWAEEPILDGHLCIHERPDEPNHQCSYFCTYDSTTFRMDLLQSTPWNEAVLNYEQMDFSDISADLPDIVTTMSDDDIPYHVDFLNSEHLDNIQHKAWFAWTFSLTLAKITNTRLYSACHVQCVYYWTGH